MTQHVIDEGRRQVVPCGVPIGLNDPSSPTLMDDGWWAIIDGKWWPILTPSEARRARSGASMLSGPSTGPVVTEPREVMLTDWWCVRCHTSTPWGQPEPYKNCCRWPFVMRLTAVQPVPVTEEHR